MADSELLQTLPVVSTTRGKHQARGGMSSSLQTSAGISDQLSSSSSDTEPYTPSSPEDVQIKPSPSREKNEAQSGGFERPFGPVSAGNVDTKADLCYRTGEVIRARAALHRRPVGSMRHHQRHCHCGHDANSLCRERQCYTPEGRADVEDAYESGPERCQGVEEVGCAFSASDNSVKAANGYDNNSKTGQRQTAKSWREKRRRIFRRGSIREAWSWRHQGQEQVVDTGEERADGLEEEEQEEVNHLLLYPGSKGHTGEDGTLVVGEGVGGGGLATKRPPSHHQATATKTREDAKKNLDSILQRIMTHGQKQSHLQEEGEEEEEEEHDDDECGAINLCTIDKSIALSVDQAGPAYKACSTKNEGCPEAVGVDQRIIEAPQEQPLNMTKIVLHDPSIYSYDEAEEEEDPLPLSVFKGKKGKVLGNKKTNGCKNEKNNGTKRYISNSPTVHSKVISDSPDTNDSKPIHVFPRKRRRTEKKSTRKSLLCTASYRSNECNNSLSSTVNDNESTVDKNEDSTNKMDIVAEKKSLIPKVSCSADEAEHWADSEDHYSGVPVFEDGYRGQHFTSRLERIRQLKDALKACERNVDKIRKARHIPIMLND